MQDDLYAFHARVFGATGTPTHLVLIQRGSNDDRTLINASGEDADDLGHYPDGVKRTLTDEQIAMFRHSEVYSILRARQVLEENRQADGYELSDSHLSDDDEVVRTQISPNKIAEAPPDQDTRYKGSKHGTGAQKTTNGLMTKTTASNKRKRHSGDSDDPQNQGHSFRRTARELDSLMEDEQILDYGDDPSNNLDSQNEVFDIPPKVSSVSTAVESTSSGCSVVQSPAVEGKKIWWPVVGA